MNAQLKQENCFGQLAMQRHQRVRWDHYFIELILVLIYSSNLPIADPATGTCIHSLVEIMG